MPKPIKISSKQSPTSSPSSKTVSSKPSSTTPLTYLTIQDLYIRYAPLNKLKKLRQQQASQTIKPAMSVDELIKKYKPKVIAKPQIKATPKLPPTVKPPKPTIQQATTPPKPITRKPNPPTAFRVKDKRSAEAYVKELFDYAVKYHNTMWQMMVSAWRMLDPKLQHKVDHPTNYTQDDIDLFEVQLDNAVEAYEAEQRKLFCGWE